MILRLIFIPAQAIGIQLRKDLSFIGRHGENIGFMMMKRKKRKSENVVVVEEDIGPAVVHVVHPVVVY